PENLGYAGGMNAGVAALRERGCDRVLLLNNDAVLEPGALRALAEALEDPRAAGAGPVVLRADDGRVESQGAMMDLARGRFRLTGHGEAPGDRQGRQPTDVLSGVALMLSTAACERVGPLDTSYFHGFEDVDWCVRARAAGFELVVVLGARVRHGGARTLGKASPERLYYAARNHLRAVEALRPERGPARWTRTLLVLLRNLAHAVRQGGGPRGAARLGVVAGAGDFLKGRTGPRNARPPGPPAA